MPNVTNSDKKRVPMTIYTSEELANTITKKYAEAVLKGYKGTKQTFLNALLTSALKEV